MTEVELNFSMCDGCNIISEQSSFFLKKIMKIIQSYLNSKNIIFWAL